MGNVRFLISGEREKRKQEKRRMGEKFSLMLADCYISALDICQMCCYTPEQFLFAYLALENI